MERALRIFSIIVSSVIFLNNTVLANEVVFIEEGKQAPYSGVLFPVERANELRRMIIEVDTLRVVNESYAKSIQLYQKTIQLHDEKYNLVNQQNERLSQALVESRRSNELQKVIWFTLGVLATGFAVYGAKKITQ